MGDIDGINLAKKIQLIAPQNLKPCVKNSRTHSAEQIEKISKSIRQFGFTAPILVDTEHGVIAGHGRLEAALKIGLARVPIIVLDHLSETQRRALMLADNRIAEEARWDYNILKEELRSLDTLDFDLDAIGFSNNEIDAFLDETRGLHTAIDNQPSANPSSEWAGMPDYKQDDKTPLRTILVHFSSEDYVREFSLVVKLPITDKTRFLWYPETIIETAADKRYSEKK